MTKLWGPDYAPPDEAMSWDEWAGLMGSLDAEEQRWRRQPARPAGWAIKPMECVGWLPYPMFDFIALLAEAMPAVQGPKFLDVGCGPGTKMRIAEVMFGMNVAGLEISPSLATAAREAGLAVEETDARAWLGYGEADLVFLNRPVAPPERLERHIMRLMKPGAVLISVNGATSPARHAGWDVVSEEYGPGPVKGIWVKPEKIAVEVPPWTETAASRVIDVPLPEQVDSP